MRDRGPKTRCSDRLKIRSRRAAIGVSNVSHPKIQTKVTCLAIVGDELLRRSAERGAAVINPNSAGLNQRGADDQIVRAVDVEVALGEMGAKAGCSGCRIYQSHRAEEVVKVCLWRDPSVIADRVQRPNLNRVASQGRQWRELIGKRGRRKWTPTHLNHFRQIEVRRVVPDAAID